MNQNWLCLFRLSQLKKTELNRQWKVQWGHKIFATFACVFVSLSLSLFDPLRPFLLTGCVHSMHFSHILLVFVWWALSLYTLTLSQQCWPVGRREAWCLNVNKCKSLTGLCSWWWDGSSSISRIFTANIFLSLSDVYPAVSYQSHRLTDILADTYISR